MQAAVVDKLPNGILAGVLTLAAYRVAGQPLAISDWVIVAAVGGATIARALTVAGPFSVMLSHTALYLLGIAIIKVLVVFRLLSAADCATLRKRLRSRFLRRF